jgi:hypothetical protein
LREIAEILHKKRLRDIRRRNLPMLEETGIVSVAGDVVSLTDNWLEALQVQRQLGKEVEAEEIARRRHEIKSRAFHSRDKRKKAKPSAVSMAVVKLSRDKRRLYLCEHAGETAQDTPSDAELVAMRRRVERLEREGMARRFAEEAVYGRPPPGPEPMHPLACECHECSARAARYARPYGSVGA